MGSLNSLVRNAMLDGIEGSGMGTINYIELENDAGLDLGRHAISWQAASNGEKAQSGTITIVVDLTSVQGITITGFRFYSDDDEQTTSNGSGVFDDAVQLDSGYEYTVNVTGITITLPE